MENQNGLDVDVTVTQATGTAEREAATDMLDRVPGRHPITHGQSRQELRHALLRADVSTDEGTPHVAQRRRSAIDGRTTRHPGYQLSQRARKRVEEIFGWVKVVERCATAVLPGTRCGLSSPLLWGCRRGGGLQLAWSNQNILDTRLITRQNVDGPSSGHDAAESKSSLGWIFVQVMVP